MRILGVFVSISVFLFMSNRFVKGEENAPPKKIRVLILDDHGPGYYNMPTAPLLRKMLNEFDGVEASLFEDAEILGTDLVFDYDVLLLHFKNYRPLRREAQAKENLARFVEDGGGLFVFHFACGAFEDWPEFVQYAGRVWDPKKPPHDPYGPFTVQMKDREHPITKKLRDFETVDELYTCFKESDVPVHVLAEAVSKVDGKKHPMAFVHEKGKGRVFHTTLGHDAKSLSGDGFRTLVREALRWIADKDREKE